MPRQVSSYALDDIVRLIARHPDGIGLGGLLAALGGVIPRRTLQRRLAALVEQRRLATSGEGRGLRYRLAPIAGNVTALTEPDVVAATAESYIPLSPEGEEIRAYVRRPRRERTPVSYRVEFLEAYRPNETFYLPESLRQQLGAMSQSPASRAPAGTFARDMLNRLLIDLSWSSSRLEGNTYSRLDTERLIELGQAAEGKDALEAQMILNHKAAIEYLVREIDHVGVTPDTVIALHALLADGLLPDPLACGRLRRRPVEIGDSVYLPIALPQRLEELFGIVVQMAGEIVDPFEQAFFLMVHVPYLQPFEDVNKRVSRLAANIPLVRRNLSPLSFIDVPQRAYIDGLLGVYELTRVELLRDVFVWAYERSCQQYVAVRQQLRPPDPLRLRYRHALTQVIGAIVRSGSPASDDAVRAALPEAVADVDRERFAALVLEELRGLHEGNAIRFGLRPLEIAAWRERAGQTDCRSP